MCSHRVRVLALLQHCSETVRAQTACLTGVSYSYGDMTDYRTLLDAMEDVDRVVFAADGADADEELLGVSNVLRSFQDTVRSHTGSYAGQGP